MRVRELAECCSLFGLLLLPLAASQVQYTSTYQGRTVTGLVGSSINFTWSFSGDVGLVKWGIQNVSANDIQNNSNLITLDRNGSSLLVSTPAAYTGRENGSRIGNSSLGQVVFTLSNITRNDEKVYACKIYKFNNSSVIPELDSVHLVVEEPPSITYPTAANTSYNESSPVNISCNTIGKPDPDVTWSHNGEVKSSGCKTAHLTFNTIRKADAGMYTCRANNSAGKTDVQLNVLVIYQATIHNISSSVSKSWIGQTVTLACKSDGVPTPALSWYKPNGTKINQVKAKENTAVVKMNSDNDFGLYNCTADNGFLPVSRNVFIQQITSQVQYTSTYQGRTVTGLVGSSINFTWSFSGDVGLVKWEIQNVSANDIQNNSNLITLDRNGSSLLVSIPAAYTGRVNGSRIGNSSLGQVVFTLSNITRNDENVYACKIYKFNNSSVIPELDSVE